MPIPSRADAWALLCEHTKTQALRRHAFAVEASMRALARRAGVGEPAELELWGVVGMLHDFDYERFPNEAQAPDREHPAEGVRHLRALGYDEEICQAILGHAGYTGVPRTTAMARTLFAVDELCGLVTAAALVRPSRSVLDLEAASVRKRLKDKAFARGVNRDDVVQGAAELGVELEAHITAVIGAMRERAALLGLAGADAAGA